MQAHFAKRYILILRLTAAVTFFSAEPGPALSQSGGIVLSYKGNMGVLISFPRVSVLIDGLHEFYKPTYLPLPSAETVKILSRKDPYANLKLALFTHYHKDHYSATLARKFLDISIQNFVMGSNQVIDSLEAKTTINAWNRNRLIYQDSASALSIRSYNIPHTYPERHSKVQNVAYVLTSGKTVILHIGDAGMELENYTQFAAQHVTILIAPIWFLTDKEGVQIISEVIKPKVIIATHISPEEKQSFDKYKVPGIPTYFFTVINQAIRI